MHKMMMIADDFTGALDTGVKFSEAGIRTIISTDIDYDPGRQPENSVLVLCVPTRHLTAEEAYRVIRRIVERFAGHADSIFKKTDSALRGNIGAELQAVLDGSGQTIVAFLPALPEMNRITVGGIHYIDGMPVRQSAFGQDPFEPVEEDSIPALLCRQCRANVQVVPIGQKPTLTPGQKTILVFDSKTQQDMHECVEMLRQTNHMDLIAGCAGLAQALVYKEHRKHCVDLESKGSDLLVVCGSVNPISLSQMDQAEHAGAPRFHLPASFLINNEPVDSGENRPVFDALLQACREHKRVLIDSLQSGEEQVLRGSDRLPLEEIRQKISGRLGEVLKTLVESDVDKRLMIIGGDTLLAFMNAIGCTELTPVREIRSGVVLSLLTYHDRTYQIISKSGGFGEANLLVTL